ncbi:MAG: hypothetical protein PUC47_07355, partial [Oscillospiraceae bacterium]|nr:hypothetical protein [Oscillospiraceae bacterium]
FAGREKVYARLPEEGNFLLLGSDGPAQGETLTASDAVLQEEQLSWLSEQLSTSEGPVFIFLHQPLSGTVAGTGKGSDVIPDDLLHSLLDDDPRVFLFTGHTHRALDGSWTVFETESGGYRIHDGCVCEVCGSSGETEQGSQGLLVEVYGDHLLLRSRDFLADQWMADAFWRLDFAF